MAAQRRAYEALDSSGVPTRDVKRRGAGWLPGLADSGWSDRLGWVASLILSCRVWGSPALGPSVVDKGFEGQANQGTWWQTYKAQVICLPKRNSKTPWPKALRRWLAGVRQIVETVYEKLAPTFRLDRERPHDLSGFQARLAAKMALHNFCIWLHEQLGRPRLAFTDLVDW